MAITLLPVHGDIFSCLIHTKIIPYQHAWEWDVVYGEPSQVDLGVDWYVVSNRASIRVTMAGAIGVQRTWEIIPCSVLSISRGHICTTYSQKTSNSSPVKVRFGVFVKGSNSDLNCCVVNDTMRYWTAIYRELIVMLRLLNTFAYWISFLGNMKFYSYFCLYSRHWYSKGNWNYSMWKTQIHSEWPVSWMLMT